MDQKSHFDDTKRKKFIFTHLESNPSCDVIYQNKERIGDCKIFEIIWGEGKKLVVFMFYYYYYKSF